MDNIRAIIKNLFCYISAEDILKGNVTYKNISEYEFKQLGSGYIIRYSNDELSNMYYYLNHEFEWQIRKLNERYKDTDGWNVFHALVVFANAVLIEENAVPECQYTQLLRWRDMITVLEEDLFITSYLAFKDYTLARERHSFTWRPVIGHNNRELNQLVSRGVAENHFHMKGSAPYFHLSWMSLMNNIANRHFENKLREYDKNLLQKKISYHAGYVNHSLSRMWRQAALIRVYLFAKLKGESDKLFKDMDDGCLEGEGQCAKCIRCINDKNILNILKDDVSLELLIGKIQDITDSLREKYKSELDYTICDNQFRDDQFRKRKNNEVNSSLRGERWFMYQMFLRAFSHDRTIKPYLNLYYMYLVLKANIRNELVQANTNVGFDNFLKYQDRKDIFVEDSPYEEVYVRMAVRDTIYNQHIESLEARITPKETADILKGAVSKFDGWITRDLNEDEEKNLKKKYFYVIHFVKEGERVTAGDDCIYDYRHYKLREKVKKQAGAITDLKDSECEEAKRIKGIDACSPEIWCRPEVFAQAFRYLKDYVSENQKTPLMATYHVGEDFLDVADGLRAIDEAILFLNLKCGDRLGHALALGVDVDEWYQSKSYRIMINKMRFLDDLTWMYAKLRQYNISDCEDVKAYIEKRFDEYFAEIYKNNISSRKKEKIMNAANEFYMSRGIADERCYDDSPAGINDYYDAWKLRGDDPEQYQHGYYRRTYGSRGSWDNYAINREFPINYKIRYRSKVAMLYYAYHFIPEVKKTGDEMIEVKVHQNFIEAVKKVQAGMQQEICAMGIGIETNPSSNYLIGTFRRYDKHPIIGWYNCGLTLDQKAMERCPQLQVSINTDDQGVFSTYIENEYAYLSLALEKSRDAQGKPMYNRTMILQWLDNIRKMGLDQSFNDEIRENK